MPAPNYPPTITYARSEDPDVVGKDLAAATEIARQLRVYGNLRNVDVVEELGCGVGKRVDDDNAKRLVVSNILERLIVAVCASDGTDREALRWAQRVKTVEARLAEIRKLVI